MRVMLIFDPTYGSGEVPDLADAFWLVRSPANAKLAAEAWDTSDQNSALFERSELPPSMEEVVARFGDIGLHHPSWTEICVIGVELTDALRRRLSKSGVTATAGRSGFSIAR